MSECAWDEFRRLVLTDDVVQKQLRAISDWPTFVAAILRLAAERGWAVTAADVEVAARRSRQAWMERSL